MRELSALDSRFLPYASWLVRVAQHYGVPVTITSTLRSPHAQAALYARNVGQTGAPGTSEHERGLAVDLVAAAGKDSREQAWLGAVWKWLGFPWSAKDAVHF